MTEKVTTIATDEPVLVEKKTDPFADVLREKARTSLDHNVSTVLTVLADSYDDHYATKKERVRGEYGTTRDGFAVDPLRPNSTNVLRDMPRVSGVETVPVQSNKVVSVPVPVPGTAIVSEPVAVQETGPATFVEK
jgi:hypothetical protein